MRVALFVDQFPKISETFILSQIDGLCASGHEITIYPCRPSDETKVHCTVEKLKLLERVRVPRKIPNSSLEKVFFYFRLLRLHLTYGESLSGLRGAYRRYKGVGDWRSALTMAEPVLHSGGKFDVLFAHFGPNGIRASWYREAGLISGPLVTVFHGFDLSSYLKGQSERMYDPLFQSGDLFLPISRYWQDKLQTLGCPADKLKVHHVGVDCDQFAFRARTHEANEPAILISVARLVEKKGIEYALRALAKIDASKLNIQYRIIGEGPLLAPLKQLVNELHLERNVIFLGVKSSKEVTDELCKAHLFLAPSVTSSTGDMEGIPTVLMEAMATGLPVVSTLHSGIPELVEDGVSGRLVGERDVEALSLAIQELISDVSSWPAMGMAGRDKVLQEFNIKHLNKQLDHLFERVAAGS